MNGTGTKRWFMSMACVTDPSRRSVNRATGGPVASTVNVAPAVSSSGHDVITGRGPRNRYGGWKTWASRWVSAGALGDAPTMNSPPPALSTVASGSSSAVAW